MPIVTYVSARTIAPNIDVPSGISVMQAALHHWVEGILGNVAGIACAPLAMLMWTSRFCTGFHLEHGLDNEKFMLSIAAEGPETNSRPSCQIKMTEELDGIIVRLPGKQK
jgi:2Fe-2S ferredoxin